MRKSTYLGLSYVLLSLVLPAGVFAQPIIRTQSPCVPVAGAAHCLTFTNTGPIPVLRALRFTAPSAGKAAVTFHGALFCANFHLTNASVVDLASQIVTDANAVATIQGPGGLRHAIRFEPGTPFAKSDTFNLASTRVVNFAAAGSKTFYMKLASLRMDEATSCFVFNAAFTLVFMP